MHVEVTDLGMERAGSRRCGKEAGRLRVLGFRVLGILRFFRALGFSGFFGFQGCKV